MHHVRLSARTCISSRAKSERTARRAHHQFRIASGPISSVLSDASSQAAAQAGASVLDGGEGRGRQKGSRRLFHDAFTFARLQPVRQPVQRFHFFMEAPMLQAHFPLLGRIDAPSVVPSAALVLIRNYRDAVRLCWALRRAKGLKPTDLGQYGFTRQHVGDYLNVDDHPTRRSLPGQRIKEFEDLMGNTAITQWLAGQARLTVLEEFQAERAA
jgi:hypothetical protein